MQTEDQADRCERHDDQGGANPEDRLGFAGGVLLGVGPFSIDAAGDDAADQDGQNDDEVQA